MTPPDVKLPDSARPKLKVLFVGAFNPPRGSSIRGGQLAACGAILNSPLTEYVEWFLLESIMESVPPPRLRRRAARAAMRVIRFAWILLRYRIDAVIIFTSSELSLLEKGMMAILAKLKQTRVVLAPRSGYLIREYRSSWLMRFWLRLVISCSDRVICQGRRWREFFVSVSGRSVANFPIIYNIVPDEDIVDMTLPDREIATQALMVGWVERNKGIFDLLDTVDRFRVEFTGLRFVICGHGRDWEEFNSLIVERKLEYYFEMRGWVDRAGTRKALSESDFCLMLSHREGMPNALLEAMAAGRPVVATCVGAVADIVDEGQSGYLCEPQDIDEIGFRILDLMRNKDLRFKMGSHARESIIRALAAEVVWKEWLVVVSGNEPALRHDRKPH